jgi:hypothetical protein
MKEKEVDGDIFANFAVKIPTFCRISSMTSGGTSESTFRTMIASSRSLIRLAAPVHDGDKMKILK